MTEVLPLPELSNLSNLVHNMFWAVLNSRRDLCVKSRPISSKCCAYDLEVFDFKILGHPFTMYLKAGRIIGTFCWELRSWNPINHFTSNQKYTIEISEILKIEWRHFLRLKISVWFTHFPCAGSSWVDSKYFRHISLFCSLEYTLQMTEWVVYFLSKTSDIRHM